MGNTGQQRLQFHFLPDGGTNEAGKKHPLMHCSSTPPLCMVGVGAGRVTCCHFQMDILTESLFLPAGN